MIKNIVVTISRESGSGGRKIGRLLAERLGWKLYDKELLNMAAQETGCSPETVANAEHAHSSRLGIALSGITGDRINNIPLNDQLFNTQSQLIRYIADHECAVIVGRCADAVLADYAPTIDIFIQGTWENRVQRVMKRENLNHEDAEKHMKRIDKTRATYHNYYADTKWGQRENYDLIINSDIGEEAAAEILYDYVTALQPRLGSLNVKVSDSED